MLRATHVDPPYSRTLGIPARHLSSSSRPTSSLGAESVPMGIEVRTHERVAPGCRDPEAFFVSPP